MSGFKGQRPGAGDAHGRSKNSDAKPGAERGMVTIELAIGLVTALTVAVFLTWIILLGVAQAKIQETSSQIARLSSRGDSAAVAKAIKDAPSRAKVTVGRSAGNIDVKVTLPVSFLNVGEVVLSANSNYPVEPGVK